MIALTLAGATSATIAYFSDGKVLGANTFTTGTVKLGNFNVASLNVTGLAPGKTITIPNFAIHYDGDVLADIFAGARGTLGPGDTGYLADKLYMRVYEVGTSNIIWEGLASALSTEWKKLATNVGAGWLAYDLTFTLDSSAGNSYQNVNNTDTEILIYAVQNGGPVPSTVPYLSTGSSWF
jgi:predicted ribosomally synthesized peptide with SipW-like signal peptide